MEEALNLLVAPSMGVQQPSTFICQSAALISRCYYILSLAELACCQMTSPSLCYWIPPLMPLFIPLLLLPLQSPSHPHKPTHLIYLLLLLCHQMPLEIGLTPCRLPPLQIQSLLLHFCYILAKQHCFPSSRIPIPIIPIAYLE